MKPHLIIVGLGNPGTGYARTRHNAGFWAVEHLGQQFGEGEWQEKQKFLCRACEGRIVTVPILLVEPLTYMNRSGECVRKLVDFYKIDPSQQLLVLCDDIDVSLGDVRFREKGGPGTHNGLRSIVTCIGEGFPRMRIGFGPAPADADLAAWVVSAPSEDERKAVDHVLQSLPEKVKKYVMEQEK